MLCFFSRSPMWTMRATSWALVSWSSRRLSSFFTHARETPSGGRTSACGVMATTPTCFLLRAAGAVKLGRVREVYTCVTLFNKLLTVPSGDIMHHSQCWILCWVFAKFVLDSMSLTLRWDTKVNMVGNSYLFYPHVVSPSERYMILSVSQHPNNKSSVSLYLIFWFGSLYDVHPIYTWH